MSKKDERLMEVTEVAFILGVHKALVYKLAKEDRLPGAFRIGKTIRVSRTVFDEWLRNPNSL